MRPILITGAARSGTSMTAGIVYRCGAKGGILAGPNNNNKRGMYENIEIRNNIVKPFLTRIGCDPLGQKVLPADKLDCIPVPLNWRKQILKVLREQGVQDDKERWFYKGAKMCLMWQVWHIAFPEAQWIVVRRDKEDIITSCMRTGFMRAHKNRKGWANWVDHHLDRFQEMKNCGLDIFEVWPTKWIEGDYSEIREAISWLGLEWNEEIYNFVAPSLWNRR